VVTAFQPGVPAEARGRQLADDVARFEEVEVDVHPMAEPVIEVAGPAAEIRDGRAGLGLLDEGREQRAVERLVGELVPESGQ
jgi:hypothetical protein